METIFSAAAVRQNGYPTSDGKPMAETERHRNLMMALIRTLQVFYEQEPRVYVSGNLLLYYERGNKRRRIAPDVFVVKGVAKHLRLNYLLWEERKSPGVVIELTSSRTRHEDTKRKFLLYQNTLKVKEYFLFDPFRDHLDPSLQGYRLRKGVYVAIRPQAGCLPSQVLGLSLEAHGQDLRLVKAVGQWLPTPAERLRLAETARQQAEAALQQAEAARQAAETELERLRREAEDLRRQRSRTSE